MFGEHYTVLERILPCLTAGLGGRTTAIAQRREAILEFFHYCVIFAGPQPYRRPESAITHLAGYVEQCADALERVLAEPASADPLAQQVYEDLDAVWQILEDATQPMESALPSADPERVGELCCLTLGRIFQWEANGHLRAHIYLRTGEKLADGLLGKERSDFLKVAHACLKETLR